MTDHADRPAGLDPVLEGDWAGWSKWSGDEPYEDHVGPFYARRDADGRMMTGCRVGSVNLRSGGIAHGGALLSFADYSLFLIAHDAIGGADGVTISLNAEFLSAAPGGARLVARGDVMRSGGSLVFVRGHIETEGEGVAVLAFSGVIKVKRPR